LAIVQATAAKAALSRMIETGKDKNCHHCGQPLIEIDNRGQRLSGCLTCNLWTVGKSAMDSP